MFHVKQRGYPCRIDADVRSSVPKAHRGSHRARDSPRARQLPVVRMVARWCVSEEASGEPGCTLFGSGETRVGRECLAGRWSQVAADVFAGSEMVCAAQTRGARIPVFHVKRQPPQKSTITRSLREKRGRRCRCCLQRQASRTCCVGGAGAARDGVWVPVPWRRALHRVSSPELRVSASVFAAARGDLLAG